LHAKKIYHRDIKTSNILVSNKGDIKLADFGLATIVHPRARYMTNRVVTLWYRSPELLLGSNVYNETVDIWSLGCVFSELLCNQAPFRANKEDDLIEKIFEKCGVPNEDNWPGVSKLPLYNKYIASKKEKRSWDLRRYYLDNPKVNSETFELMKLMLEMNPAKRITAKEALNHDYFYSDPQICPKNQFPKIEKESHEMQIRNEKKPYPYEIKNVYQPNFQNQKIAYGDYKRAEKKIMAWRIVSVWLKKKKLDIILIAA